jgi:hypothetical protein
MDDKNNPFTVPPPGVIAERIQSCRDEIAELKKLLRIATAAKKADSLRRGRVSATEGVAK